MLTFQGGKEGDLWHFTPHLRTIDHFRRRNNFIKLEMVGGCFAYIASYSVVSKMEFK